MQIQLRDSHRGRIAKLHGVLDGVAAGVSAEDQFHTVSVCAL